MSTRCAIIQKTNNGYEGIQCRFDGYLASVGIKLVKYYSCNLKITKLINKGFIVSLHDSLFDVDSSNEHDSIKGCTLLDITSQIAHMGNVYTFDSGYWYYNNVLLLMAIIKSNCKWCNHPVSATLQDNSCSGIFLSGTKCKCEFHDRYADLIF